MFIDTHAHLYLKEFKPEIEQIINRAKSAGIKRIYLPNIDQSSIEDVYSLTDAYPDLCFPMMGLHPCYVKENYEEQLAIIKSQFEKRRFKAIGEIGIDLHWDLTYQVEQELAFIEQINWAKEYNLPIVIHSRKSLHKTIELIESHQDGNLNGVFHCFNGSIEEAKRIQKVNFKMGLGGVITFKNAGLDEMLSYLDDQYIVLETDAPYLSPHPHRGKQNESSYIPFIASKLAKVRGVSVEEVATITSKNALDLFESH